MKPVNYASLMKSIAEEKAQAIARGKAVKGIILVGSVAKGDVTRSSDIDLFCIGEFEHKRQKDKIKDIFCDVSFVSTSFFQRAFEESDLLVKGTKIDFLRHGIVLYDPKGILGELKERAKSESWSDKDLQTARKSALSAIQEFRETTKKFDLVKNIVSIRGLCEIVGAYIVMKNGGLVFYPPMYMLDSLKKTDFSITYQKANCLVGVSKEVAENITRKVEVLIYGFLKRYPEEEALRRETYGLSSGMQTEIKHARDCIKKEKIMEAILQARFAYTLYSNVRLWETWGSEWKKKDVRKATYGLGTIRGRILLHKELERIGGDLYAEYYSILGLDSTKLSEKELVNLLGECERQVKASEAPTRGLAG